MRIVGYLKNKSITMHGNMNVKFSCVFFGIKIMILIEMIYILTC